MKLPEYVVSSTQDEQPNQNTDRLSETYVYLLHNFVGSERASKQGQAVLSSLRDAIAESLGMTPQEVQEHHEALALQMLRDES